MAVVGISCYGNDSLMHAFNKLCYRGNSYRLITFTGDSFSCYNPIRHAVSISVYQSCAACI